MKQQEATKTTFQDALGWHFKTVFFRCQLKALEIQFKDFIIIICIEKYVNIFLNCQYCLHTLLHSHKNSYFFVKLNKSFWAFLLYTFCSLSFLGYNWINFLLLCRSFRKSYLSLNIFKNFTVIIYVKEEMSKKVLHWPWRDLNTFFTLLGQHITWKKHVTAYNFHK